MRIPYFPGCTLHSKARGFDASARAAALALDIVMEELPEWTCCGATFPMAADSAMGLVAPTRILASAKDAGKLLTLCSFCYNTLKRTNRVLTTDAERRRKVTTFIEEDYEGNVRTVHLLEVLRDEVALRAGPAGQPYWPQGRALLRVPPAAAGRRDEFDDPERPILRISRVSAAGGGLPHKTECCGSFVTVSSPETATACSARILETAAKLGAEMLVVSCPLCQYNLDRAQREARAGQARAPRVTVLYFSQLLAIALGCDEACLHLDGHAVDPRPRLSAWLEQKSQATVPA
jgi:heterodisulfide reductase subunit B